MNNTKNINDKLPLSTYLLSLAQTINLTMAVLSVSVGALVGLKLSPNQSLGTIPYGLQFLFVMLFTYLASILMNKKGRAFVFYIASIFLFLASIFGFFAIENNNFLLLCISHSLLGIYICCANFYRFAATDNIDNHLKSKAISLVVLGGVLAGIIGPFLAIYLRHPLTNFKEFSLCYGIMSFFAILNTLLIYVWQKSHTNQTKKNTSNLNNTQEKIFNKSIAVSAILTTSIGYLIMNLLMIQSSLIMKSICSFDNSSKAIQMHVLAMFLPSFITGKLINKFGNWFIVHIGFVLLAISSIWGIYFADYQNIVIELIILGLGWNFSYVGGSTLLASNMPDNIKHKLQGINDTIIAMCATIGAFSPAVLYSYMGWSNTHIVIFILCIIIITINLIINFINKNKSC